MVLFAGAFVRLWVLFAGAFVRRVLLVGVYMRARDLWKLPNPIITLTPTRYIHPCKAD